MDDNIASLNLNHKQRSTQLTNDVLMHIGKRLKELMRAQSVSTELMASYCGVTAGAVSNWFSTGHITRENMVIAADVLGVSVRYLITGDERDLEASDVLAEWARRDVAPSTRDAILTLLRASPLRAARPAATVAPTPAPAQPPAAGDADAAHFARSIVPPTPAPRPGQSKKRS